MNALSLVLGAVLGLAACIAQAATPTEQRAVDLLQALVAGNGQSYVDTASPQMLKALTREQLLAVFADLRRQGGEFKALGEPRTEQRDGFFLVEVPLEYAEARQVARVVSDASGRLMGLQIRPWSDPAAYQSAPYSSPARFVAREVVVDAGGWPLPGTLVMPQGDGPFPAVVLVHGSGPSDRDASMGPNRMFRDIAEGLASRGVAVLRYEKRSREHAQRLSRMQTLTPRDEVIDDVLAALRLLRQTPAIDADAVLVAGHSFGGTLAPSIAGLDGRLAGVILLAGAIRPMEDSIVSQTRYLAGLDGEVSAEEARQIAGYEALARQVRALKKVSDAPPRATPFSAPTSYWLGLRALDPVVAAGSLHLPVLVLQGERDYQVTMDDFAAWKRALAANPRSEFRSFPALNHAFMSGSGPSSPAEYSRPNHVDAAVIETMATWVQGVASACCSR